MKRVMKGAGEWFFEKVLVPTAENPRVFVVGALIGTGSLLVIQAGYGLVMMSLIWTWWLLDFWFNRKRTAKKQDAQTERAVEIARQPLNNAKGTTVWVRDSAEELVDGYKVNSGEILIPSGSEMRVSREIAEKLLVEAGYWPKQEGEAP